MTKYGDALLGTVGVIALGLFWWMNLEQAGAAASFFNCSANDGCFQMFNPLRRLAAGQSIGSDFQFFYGPGSILLHYPLFKLYGADLLASEAARILMTPPLFMGATFAFLRVLMRRTGVALFLTGLATWFGFQWFMTVAIGHNSLFGLRAAVPVASAALLLYAFRDRAGLDRVGLKPSPAVLGLGGMAAIAMFVSPDQGAVMTLATTLVLIAMSASIRSAIKNTVFFIATAIMGTIALYGLATGPQLLETLRFHFIEAPGDQLWYFGVPPHPFFYSWQGVNQHLGLVITGEIALLIGSVSLVARGRLGHGRAAAIAYLCLYGVLSCIGILGYIKPAYFDALKWCVMLCAVALLSTAIEKSSVALRSRKGLMPLLMRICFAFAVTIIAAYIVFSGVMTLRISKGFNDIIAGMQAQSEKTALLGVTMDKEWTEHRDMVNGYLAETRPEESAVPLWSTYASIAEAELGIFNPDTDYIIHTLGEERRAKYAESFTAARPEVVVTTDPWLLYNEWLWQSHWDFFEQVATDYDYRDRTWKGAVWTRRGEVADIAEEWSDAWVTAGGSMAIMRFADADDRNIWTVRLRYEVNNPWGAIPVIGGMPRFFVWAKGGRNPLPVSLPPKQNEFVFPVFTEGDSPVWLKTDVRSLLPGARLRIVSAEFRKVDVPEGNMSYFFRKAHLQCVEDRGFIKCDDRLPAPDDEGADMEEYPRTAGEEDDEESDD
ncbi:MAG: hypothetical protein U9Q03_02030 [Patescibacteria group bacterium]|nr:hypothetical protein [Patescibacteria group bacterium]